MAHGREAAVAVIARPAQGGAEVEVIAPEASRPGTKVVAAWGCGVSVARVGVRVAPLANEAVGMKAEIGRAHV